MEEREKNILTINRFDGEINFGSLNSGFVAPDSSLDIDTGISLNLAQGTKAIISGRTDEDIHVKPQTLYDKVDNLKLHITNETKDPFVFHPFEPIATLQIVCTKKRKGKDVTKTPKRRKTKTSNEIPVVVVEDKEKDKEQALPQLVEEIFGHDQRG